MKLNLFKKSEDKIVENEQKNDEYLIYAERFANNHVLSFGKDEKGNLQFDNPQGLLAARVSNYDYSLEELYSHKDLISYENLVNFNKDYFLDHSIYQMGACNCNGQSVFYYYTEDFPTSEHYDKDYIGLNEKVLERGNPEHLYLDYDGICAFLALAPDKLLMKYKDAVMSELKRNASEEMREVKLSEKSVDKIKDEIGEKYLELSGAALVMFEQANERLLMEEAEQARLVEEQAKFEAEQESLKTEYEQDLRDNEARTAEAYAGVMEKLDLFSKINDENLGQNE